MHVRSGTMIIRWMKISLALVLSLIFTISLTKLVLSVWENFNFGTSERYDVEVWLEQNQLHQYKETFRRRGEYHTRRCFPIFSIYLSNSICRVCTVHTLGRLRLTYICRNDKRIYTSLHGKCSAVYTYLENAHIPYSLLSSRYTISNRVYCFRSRPSIQWCGCDIEYMHGMVHNTVGWLCIYRHTKPPVFVPWQRKKSVLSIRNYCFHINWSFVVHYDSTVATRRLCRFTLYCRSMVLIFDAILGTFLAIV